MDHLLSTQVSLFLFLAAYHLLLSPFNCQFALVETLQLTVASSGGDDACAKMIVSSNQLYHMRASANESQLEKWDLASSADTSVFSHTFPFHATDYNHEGTTGAFAVINANQTRQQVYPDLSNTSQVQLFTNYTGNAKYVYIKGTRTRLYADLQPGAGVDLVYHISFNTGVSAGYSAASFDNQAVMTPDGTKLIAWSIYSEVFVYDVSAAGLPLLLTINHTHTLTTGTTTNIAVSADSTLAIIETDNKLPLTVVSLTDGSIVEQHSFSAVIVNTFFVPNSDLIVIMDAYHLYLLDRTTSTTNLLSGFTQAVTTSMYDHQNEQFYTCSSSTIKQMSINPSISSNATNTTTNSTTNATANATNLTTSTNTTATVVIQIYIIRLYFTPQQQEVMDYLTLSLGRTSAVMAPVVMLTRSNPYTFVFLSFINFFTLSTHYVLLNMPLPQQLYQHLSHFYTQVNLNVISRYLSHLFNQVTTQRVDRPKLLELGLTTDLPLSQSANALMALANTVFFALLIKFVRKLGKNSLLRKLLDQQYSDVLCGQYVSLMLPLMCPWVFFITGSYQSFNSKINSYFQYFLFVLSLVFSLFYLVHLALVNAPKKKSQPKQIRPQFQQNERKQGHERLMVIQVRKKGRVIAQQREKENIVIYDRTGRIQQTIRINPSRFKHKDQDKTKNDNEEEMNAVVSKLCISSLMAPQVLDGWYIVVSNFVYPLVLVLAQPEIALATLFLHILGGVVIARRQTDYACNRLILSLYPLFFHLCFIVFRVFSTHNFTLVVTQMICLIVLLLGSIHHVLFILYFFIITVRNHFKSTRKVQPTPKVTNSQVGNQSSSHVSAKTGTVRIRDKPRQQSKRPKVERGRLAVGKAKELRFKADTTQKTPKVNPSTPERSRGRVLRTRKDRQAPKALSRQLHIVRT